MKAFCPRDWPSSLIGSVASLGWIAMTPKQLSAPEPPIKRGQVDPWQPNLP